MRKLNLFILLIFSIFYCEIGNSMSVYKSDVRSLCQLSFSFPRKSKIKYPSQKIYSFESYKYNLYLDLYSDRYFRFIAKSIKTSSKKIELSAYASDSPKIAINNILAKLRLLTVLEALKKFDIKEKDIIFHDLTSTTDPLQMGNCVILKII